MLRKIACLIPAQLCFILHHLSWWKLLFAVGNFQVTLKLWFTDAWYTHISKFAVLVETKQCLCVSLFVMQEMEERIQHFETFLWDGEKTCQVDPEQLGTTKTHTNWERKSEGASESGPPTKKKTHREKNPVPLVLLGGNTTRTRLRTETFNGAIVSGTWPDPDPFYRTKLLEVCQSHLRTHTNGDGQPWCYSGAYFYPCCSRDYFLTRTTSKTNRSGDVISQPGHLCPEQALHTRSYTPWYLAKHAFLQTHTHTYSDPHQQKCECRVLLGDEDR